MVGIVSEELARERSATLLHRHPLPSGWSLAETFVQEVSIAARKLCMVGMVASRGSEQQALGSAAERDAYPVERAYFELLERISILEAQRAAQLVVRDRAGNALSQRSAARVFARDAFPQRLRLALSNGVALHTSWQRACDAALRELVERDRVLRSFAGELAVHPLPGRTQAFAPEYATRAYALGEPGRRLGLHVVSVLLAPSVPENPLVYGFAAAESLEQASAAAAREAEQRLAFLWGEALPETAPQPAPTPDYHQEYYLCPAQHAELFAWLEGQRLHTGRRAGPAFDGDDISFVDLTPSALREAELYVVKAVAPHARKLRFGAARKGAPHPVV